jgi:hypothetical protein
MVKGHTPEPELSFRMIPQKSAIKSFCMDSELEKKGYVLRDRGQEDRRVIKVQLTPEGKRSVRKAPNPAQGKMIYGLRRLKKEKLNLIYDCIQELVEIMKAQNVKVTFFFDQE